MTVQIRFVQQRARSRNQTPPHGYDVIQDFLAGFSAHDQSLVALSPAAGPHGPVQLRTVTVQNAGTAEDPFRFRLLEAMVNAADIFEVRRVLDTAAFVTPRLCAQSRNFDVCMPPVLHFRRGVPVTINFRTGEQTDNPSRTPQIESFRQLRGPRLEDTATVGMTIPSSSSMDEIVAQRFHGDARRRNGVEAIGTTYCIYWQQDPHVLERSLRANPSTATLLGVYMSSISLFHELLGHGFLYLRRINRDHGQDLTRADNVESPFRPLPFVGSVDSFITGLQQGWLIPLSAPGSGWSRPPFLSPRVYNSEASPTFKVSTDFLVRAFRDFGSLFSHSPLDASRATELFAILACNFRIMCQMHPDPRDPDSPFGTNLGHDARNAAMFGLGHRLLGSFIQLAPPGSTNRTVLRDFLRTGLILNHATLAPLSRALITSFAALILDRTA